MHTFMEEYRRWMDSPALSEEEWKELKAIEGDEKEIKERFFAPLEFGTAGLRGTMKTGLHNMNIHIIRHATQAFADVISAEGEEAKKKGIVIAHDCRLHGREFAEEARRNTTATRSTGPTARSCRRNRLMPSPRKWRRQTSSPASKPVTTQKPLKKERS